LERKQLIIKKSTFFIFIVLFVNFSAKAQLKEKLNQTKLFTQILDTSSHNRRIVFFPSPFISLSPETSWAFGLNVNSVFKLDTLSSHYSSIYVSTGYSLKKQFTTLLSHSIFLKNDGWFLKGRISYLDFPLMIYEIGNRSLKEDGEKIFSNGFLTYQKVLRKIAPKTYLGLQYRFYRLIEVKALNEAGWFMDYQPKGYDGFSLSGLGFNFHVDTRNNTHAPHKGVFFDVSYYNYNERIKSSHSFTTLDFDLRIFTRPFTGKSTILAFWIYNSFSQGDVVWSELPQTGVYGSTRGYMKGRYRDDYFLAYEMELRTPLWWRFWGVGFAGISTVAKNGKKPEFWNPSGGLGLRFLLKNKEQLYTGVDFAWGVDRNKGIYARLGQAF